MIRTLDARALGVDAVVGALERPPSQVPADVSVAVDEILAGVRARGDAAVLEYTAKFDGFAAASVPALAIAAAGLDAALRALEPAARAALDYAADRIERYHAAAMPKSWRLTDEHGSSLGQEVRPLDRVGIYIPGGRAAYRKRQRNHVERKERQDCAHGSRPVPARGRSPRPQAASARGPPRPTAFRRSC